MISDFQFRPIRHPFKTGYIKPPIPGENSKSYYLDNDQPAMINFFHHQRKLESPETMNLDYRVWIRSNSENQSSNEFIASKQNIYDDTTNS